MTLLVLTRLYPSASSFVFGTFVDEHVQALRATQATAEDIRVIHLDDRAPFGTVSESCDALHLGTRVQNRLLRRSMKLLYFPLPIATAHLVARRCAAMRVTRVVSVMSPVNHVAWLTAKRLSAEWSAHIEHSSDFLPVDPNYPRSRFVRRWRGSALSPANAVVAVSSTLAQSIIDHFGVPAEKLHVVPNAVGAAFTETDAGAMPIASEPLRIVTIGLMVPSKKIDLLLQAASEVAATRGVALEIIGDGPERQNLEALAASLGLASRTTFHGLLEKADVAAVAARCSIFVMASEFETFCVAAAEALCLGLPIVSTRSGGPETFIPDEFATFIDNTEPRILAAAILRETARDTASRRSRARSFGAALLDRDRVGEKLWDVIEGRSVGGMPCNDGGGEARMTPAASNRADQVGRDLARR